MRFDKGELHLTLVGRLGSAREPSQSESFRVLSVLCQQCVQLVTTHVEHVVFTLTNQLLSIHIIAYANEECNKRK